MTNKLVSINILSASSAVTCTGGGGGGGDIKAHAV